MKKILIFLVLALGLVWLWSLYDRNDNSFGRDRKIQLSQIGEDLYHFSEQLGNGNVTIGDLLCKGDAGCVQGEPVDPTSTVRAHIILPYSKADLASPGYKKVKTEISENNDIYAQQTNWELYLSYRRTGDKDIYKIFYNNVVRNLILFKYPKILEVIPTRSPMFAAQLLLPVAYALQSFNAPEFQDPEIQTFVKNHPYSSFNPDYLLETVKQRGRDALEATSKLMPQTETASPESTLFEGTDIKVDACWAFFLSAESYLATKENRYKDEVDVMRQSFNFSRRQKKEMRFEVLQNVLPCLQGFMDLRADPFYKTILEADIAYLTNVILSNYDGKARPLCDGTGGLLAVRIESEKYKCEDANLSVADASWASYMFAGNNETITLD